MARLTHIAAAWRAARERRGYTVDQVAEILQMPASGLRHIEAAQSAPSARWLYGAASLYCVSETELLP
jgi:transcriptional regulator with XRE-family HTH domain